MVLRSVFPSLTLLSVIAPQLFLGETFLWYRRYRRKNCNQNLNFLHFSIQQNLLLLLLLLLLLHPFTGLMEQNQAHKFTEGVFIAEKIHANFKS